MNLPPLIVWQVYEVLVVHINNVPSLLGSEVVEPILDSFVVVSKVFIDIGYSIKALEILRNVVTLALRMGNMKQASSISLLIGKLFKLRLQVRYLYFFKKKHPPLPN